MRFARVVVVAVVVAVVAAGCGGGNGGGTPPPPEVGSVTLSPTTANTMSSIGDQLALTAQVKAVNGADLNSAAVSWTSSNNAVITLNPVTGRNVTATATGNGSATVMATSGTKSDDLAFTVQQAFASVGFAPASPTVTVGQSTVVTARGRDARGNTIAAGVTAQSITGNDDSKMTVTANGNVATLFGVAAGNATLTAEMVQGTTTRTGSVAVNVTAAPPQRHEVTTNAGAYVPPTLTIKVGDEVRWTIAVLAHTVTFDENPPVEGSSGSLNPGQTFTGRFNTVGPVRYHCEIHGGMTGTITVSP